MEFPIYQQNWQDIHFRNVCGSDDYKGKVADSSFYESFYKTLFASNTEISPSWLAKKRAVSEWVEKTFLQPMRDKLGESFRILSIGAGMGVVEEPWIQKGYRVELQECIEVSLMAFRESHPRVPVYICDGKKIPLPDNSYDLIFFSGVEYVFDHVNYTFLLKEVSRLLRRDGIALCISFSNLSLHELCLYTLRKIVRPLREQEGSNGKVLWGWARTIGSHISLGREVGMEAESIYIFEPKIFKLLTTRKPSFLWTRPALTTTHIAIAWRKK